MHLLRRLIGAAPTPTDDGAFSPSPLALKLATTATTNYDGGHYPAQCRGPANRILMVCTEERHMVMANGRAFSTGNHPVEMALPMLHLMAAGFAIDIATPTGAPVAIEDWAMPREDGAVTGLFRDRAADFAAPRRLADIAGALADDSDYIAVFLPGGHGAMLGLPENGHLGKLLRWADETGRHTLAICHGPAALLASGVAGEFPYGGYSLAAFPDKVDRQTPMIGYMPGQMPWFMGDALREHGMTLVNSKADASCHVDRRLITGASPEAANAFGRLSAETLLKRLA